MFNYLKQKMGNIKTNQINSEYVNNGELPIMGNNGEVESLLNDTNHNSDKMKVLTVNIDQNKQVAIKSKDYVIIDLEECTEVTPTKNSLVKKIFFKK